MKFATKLVFAKTVTAIIAIAIAVIVVNFLRSVSWHYCHGASHNAHGAYCQAVYQDDYSAIR